MKVFHNSFITVVVVVVAVIVERSSMMRLMQLCVMLDFQVHYHLALTIVQFFSMNEELMLIYLKLHLMPYAIHEMRQYPINVRMFFKI